MKEKERMSCLGATQKGECKQVIEMKAQISAKLLKNIINIQNTIVDDGKLFFNGEYVEMNDVDPAHVMMITQKIPTSEFLAYHNADDMKLGLSFDRLTSVLKNIKKDDVIKLSYDENNNKLLTQIGAFNQKISLIDPENMPSPKQPNLDFGAKVTIGAKEFYDFLRQAGGVSDYIELSTYNDMLYLFAEDCDESNHVLVKYHKSDLKQFSVCKDLCASLFSIDYLIRVVRFLKVKYDDLTIHFGNDVPLRIECRNGTETVILLAPRIEEDTLIKSRFDRIKRGYEDIPN